jgi:hypothetical protein
MLYITVAQMIVETGPASYQSFERSEHLEGKSRIARQTHIDSLSKYSKVTLHRYPNKQ